MSVACECTKAHMWGIWPLEKEGPLVGLPGLRNKTSPAAIQNLLKTSPVTFFLQFSTLLIWTYNRTSLRMVLHIKMELSKSCLSGHPVYLTLCPKLTNHNAIQFWQVICLSTLYVTRLHKMRQTFSPITSNQKSFSLCKHFPTLTSSKTTNQE